MTTATKRAIRRKVLRIRKSFRDCAELMDEIVYSGSLK